MNSDSKGLLAASERKIPEQVVEESEDALAKQLDILSFAVHFEPVNRNHHHGLL